MHSLRARLLFTSLLPTLIFFPLIAFALIYLVETKLLLPSLSKELVDQAMIVSELLHDLPTVWQDQKVAGDFVQRIHPDTEDQLMLLTSTGELLATSDARLTPWLGKRLKLPHLDGLGIGETRSVRHDSQERGWDIIDVITSVVVKNEQTGKSQIVGIVRMTYPLSGTQSDVASFRRMVWLILLVGLIMRMATGLFFTWSLERPLAELAVALEQWTGEKKIPLTEPSVKEVRLAVRAFNGLSERLHLLETTRRQLLANLIHEIRRPLGAFNSALYALANGASDEIPLRTELLESMSSEVRRLHRLMDDLTLLHQQSVGMLELTRQPTDMATWLPPLLTAWRVTAQDKGITWQAELMETPLMLSVDGDRLAQAVGNLLNNAIKFTPTGGRITIHSGVNNQALDHPLFLIRISDTGIGIALEEQQRIFEPYFRSPLQRSLPQGMGIGLTIARDLVTAHGGSLTVESAPQTGSHFTIQLPIVQSPPTDRSASKFT